MTSIHISDKAFTAQRWQAYYALMESLSDKYDSPLARTGWEAYKKRIHSAVASDPNYFRFVVFENELALGWADFNVFSPGTPDQSISVSVDFVYDTPPQDFNQLVAAELGHLMERVKISLFHMAASTQRISALARLWSGKELNRLNRFRLVRKEANSPLMKSWLNEIPSKNPDLRLEFFSPLPEEQLLAHTELFVQYINEMPTEHEPEKPFQMSVDEIKQDMLWQEENNVHVYTFALFDSAQRMIAHSNASISADDPSDVYQAMTGVNQEYRGRGLSRWLKAALFFKVGEDFPTNETMTTDMRAVNAPIQKVNAEMGYELHSSGNEFEISAQALAQYTAG